jgi:hypothetical protein
MHFEIEHHFTGTASAVLEAMVDADLYRGLELPDLSLPDVLATERGTSTAKLQLRYTFVGHLDPIARQLLGGGELRWVQLVEVDFEASTGRLSFAAEDQPSRLHGAAAISFSPREHGVERDLDGDVVVAVPFVGPLAERNIVKGLLARLDLEALAIVQRSRPCDSK